MPQTKSQDEAPVLDAVLNGDSAGGDLTGTYPNPTIDNGKVDTTALKTATGEVSSTAAESNNTLPGGEYGFYPRVKMSTSTPHSDEAQMKSRSSGGAWTSYVTNVSLRSIDGGRIYCQQRYVTASGTNHWIFLLIDKTTKEIIGAYQAPDHPSYGNGGDPNKVPHPFGSYDELKHEIVLLDKETCNQLKSEATEQRSILTLVNEEYKPNLSKEETYVPLHSGKFLGQVQVMIDTIPDYISVRKLIKLTQLEKDIREEKAEEIKVLDTQNKIKKQQDKLSAVSKLVVLGLTEDEISALTRE